MCTANIQGLLGRSQDKQDDNRQIDPTKQPGAGDVPLGDGLAGEARTSILTRKERIEQALAEAGA